MNAGESCCLPSSQFFFGRERGRKGEKKVRKRRKLDSEHLFSLFFHPIAVACFAPPPSLFPVPFFYLLFSSAEEEGEREGGLGGISGRRPLRRSPPPLLYVLGREEGKPLGCFCLPSAAHTYEAVTAAGGGRGLEIDKDIKTCRDIFGNLDNLAKPARGRKEWQRQCRRRRRRRKERATFESGKWGGEGVKKRNIEYHPFPYFEWPPPPSPSPLPPP